MFGFLKNLLGKPASKQAPAQGPSVTASNANGARPAGTPLYRNVAKGNGASAPVTAARHGGTGIEVTVRGVLSTLPLELQPQVAVAEPGEGTLLVPLERVLPQLSHGVVKISFAELCFAAPQVFVPSADLDNMQVILPLEEILSRINPALLKRRRVQRHVTVPDDITSPFDGKSRAAVAAPEKPAPTAPSDSSARKPFKITAPIPTRGGLASTSTPPPPSLPLNTPVLPPPTRPVNGNGNDRRPISMQPQPPLPMPKPSTPTPIPMRPLSAATNPDPKPANQAESLTIPLTAIAESFPETIRKEIVQTNLLDARLVLPCDMVEQSLKRGKVCFSWTQLKAWMPHPSAGTPSPNGEMLLELPLKIVAPLFLAKRAENKPRNKVEIDENIPNLFFGFPQADPSPVASSTAKPSDTNYYVWDDKSEAIHLDGAADGTPSVGTKFVSKYATPNEIVSRAAALDCVAGALIALPDGLLVASQIPSDFNPDTLAAFLPMIFGKVSTCTKELRMGELNNLNFTVGNVPWKIFRVNAIFFAAFGRAGEGLPTAQLAALAAELDHKPK